MSLVFEVQAVSGFCPDCKWLLTWMYVCRTNVYMYAVGLHCLGHYYRVVTTFRCSRRPTALCWSACTRVLVLDGNMSSCHYAHMYQLSPFFLVVVPRSLVQWLLVGHVDAVLGPWQEYEGHGWSWNAKVVAFILSTALGALTSLRVGRRRPVVF